ncbi:hypothetical protein [Sulfoacidibacillus thermotolerans]|uniref:hypothetical protein n=1 Tax=Sulfoacidibacillus thermotolerans TaxID=1765684 RepID=UPI0015E7EC71|nr:hypothetical protein [Sulfoacidibacillus thermotolerans]
MMFWVIWGVAALCDALFASIPLWWMALALVVSAVSLPVSMVASVMCGYALLFLFRRAVLRVVGMADVLAFPVFASINSILAIIGVVAAFALKRWRASLSPVPILPFLIGAVAIGMLF